jgi:hypothetical protein
MFTTTFRRAATVMVALAALAACDNSPVGPVAESIDRAASVSTPSGNIISHQSGTSPFSFVLYASCANGGQGEVLGAHGTLEFKGQFVTTSGGQRQHNAVVTRFTGVATGWDSGDVYDVVQRENIQSNIDYGSDGIPDSGEQGERVQVRLTNRATGGVIDVVLVGRFVQSANGEYVLSGWQGTARCR